MNRLKVSGHDCLYRDTKTNAIINTDNASRLAYRKKIEQRKEFDALKEEVEDIKKMLAMIWNKLND